MRLPGASALVLAALLGIAATGCPVRLVAPYDPVLAQGMSQVANDIESFASTMKVLGNSPEATYLNHRAFYGKTLGALRSLRMQAAATPKNTDLLKAIDALSENLEMYRMLHAAGTGLSESEIEEMRQTLEDQLESCFKLLSEMRRER
jgi:hypothetical protein